MKPPVPQVIGAFHPSALRGQYLAYLRVRSGFLLERLRTHRDFPGFHTGYDSITGEEFPPEDILSYSWINGRGVSVLTELSQTFEEYHDEMLSQAERLVDVMRTQYRINNGHFPFVADMEGCEVDIGCSCPTGYSSYSDLYCCLGIIEYAEATGNSLLRRWVQKTFLKSYLAVRANRFVPEPSAPRQDRRFENPMSISLDVCNEFYRRVGDEQYLDMSAELLDDLFRFHVPELNVFVESLSPVGQPLPDAEGGLTMDPGHVAEFIRYALDFRSLAASTGRHKTLASRVRSVCPDMLLTCVSRGWNSTIGGMYKTVDARTGIPIDETMPWWILPETMLTCLQTYHGTGRREFLDWFIHAHNVYFTRYMNERTTFGPFQNLNGRSGQPIRVVPACKFQDPEFHAGRNLLKAADLLEAIPIC